MSKSYYLFTQLFKSTENRIQIQFGAYANISHFFSLRTLFAATHLVPFGASTHAEIERKLQFPTEHIYSTFLKLSKFLFLGIKYELFFSCILFSLIAISERFE